MTFAIAALEATFALTVPAVYGYAAAGVGGLLAFAGLVQAIAQGYLVGKLVPRTGEAALAVAGAAALAIGLAPLGSWSSHAALYGMLILIASGYGLGTTAVATLISRRTGRELQGEALGLNQSVLSLARVIGPYRGRDGLPGDGTGGAVSGRRGGGGGGDGTGDADKPYSSGLRKERHDGQLGGPHQLGNRFSSVRSDHLDRQLAGDRVDALAGHRGGGRGTRAAYRGFAPPVSDRMQYRGAGHGASSASS